MTVKGSKQYRSVVVPYRPLHRLFWIAGLTVMVCLLVFGSFWLGYRESQRDYRFAIEEWSQLQDLAAQQAEQLQALNLQVNNTRKGSEVDHQTMEGLRQEILLLNEQIAQLEQSNHFYRQLMEPEKSRQGLNISSWQVRALAEPRHYQFELVVQHLSVEHRVVSGRLAITLTGTEGGVSKSYSLHELSTDIQKPDIAVKLRFYQTLSGKLVLPEGFEPTRVEVTAEKTGGSPVTASFDWVAKKSFH